MRLNRWRVYLNPFDDFGVYSGYVEITDDVVFDSMGQITQNLDNVDYDIGIYRTDNISIQLRNDSGKYSDVGYPESIFRYKRSDSLIKITWTNSDVPARPGFCKTGSSFLSQEMELFVGLLNDDSMSMDLDSQTVEFILAGREDKLRRCSVPTASIATPSQTATISIASPAVITTPSPHGLVAGNPISFNTTGALPGNIESSTPYYVSAVPSAMTFQISDSRSGSSLEATGTQSGTHTLNLLFGQNISDVIYGCLNQPQVTSLLTVAPANLSLGIDTALDSTVDLFNRTAWSGISELLFISNSVLYVDQGVVKVAPRDATLDVKYHFYGQASTLGIENIQNITGIKSGMSRTFNSLSWTPSQVKLVDQASIDKYLTRSKIFDQTEINQSSKQLAIMTSILNEFSTPKMELDLHCPLGYQTLALKLLDRVDIDYPTVPISGDFSIPICGQAICGDAVLPDMLWAFTIDQDSPFKIIGKSLDIGNAIYTLHLRRI